jgi:hypothetical protein
VPLPALLLSQQSSLAAGRSTAPDSWDLSSDDGTRRCINAALLNDHGAHSAIMHLLQHDRSHLSRLQQLGLPYEVAWAWLTH